MRNWICTRCFTQLAGETAGVCPSCGGEDVVPLESPRGQALLGQVAPPPPIQLPPTKPGDVVCPSCLSVGPPLKTGAGSVAQLVLVAIIIVTFIFFWPAGLVLLLILIIDAVTAKTKCRGCGNVGVIPANSPGARPLLQRNIEMQRHG